MIATRTTPALLLANDAEAATVSPTATTSSGTAILQLRQLALLIASISSLSFLRLPGPFLFKTVILSVSRAYLKVVRSRSSFHQGFDTHRGLIGRPRPAATAAPREDAIPDAHQAPRGDQNNDEEDDPDDGVEGPAEERATHAQQRHVEVTHVVLDHDESEGADPGALDPQEAADHRHDEQVDRLGKVDVSRRDLTAPPDVEDAAE